MDIKDAFGKAVKSRRAERGLTQEMLADSAEMGRSYVSGVERGTINASVTSVWRMAQVLDCKPSDLWLSAERIAIEPAPKRKVGKSRKPK